MSQVATHHSDEGSPITPPTGEAYHVHSHPQGNGNSTKKADSGNGVNNYFVAYDDDEADVKLKSSDGRVFKVESYLLKAQGPHFRSVLAHPTSDPIPIEASTKVLKIILDLMHHKPAPSGAIWAYRTQILKLCDELQLKGVAERVLFSMHENVDKDAWAVFCLASQRNSLALARSALRAMDEGAGVGGKVRVDKLSPEAVKDVAIPYLLGVFAAALKAAEGADKGVQVGWKEVADKFVPISSA